MPIDLANETKGQEGAAPEPETPESRKDDTLVEGEDPEADADASEPTPENAEETEESEEDALLSAGIEGLSKDEEGNYVMLVNPDDPSYGVFKGKTPAELLQNMRKGKVDSENYIRELKIKQTDSAIRDRMKSKQESEPLDDIQIPDFDSILADAAKRLHVPPEMFGWGRQEWKEYAETEGALDAYEAKRAVEKAKQVAEAAYADANLNALNDINLREELTTVAELLTETGVQLDDINLDDILSKIENDKSNFTKEGLRRHGRIVAAVTREISRLAAPKQERKVQQDVQRKIAEAAAKKKKAARTTGDVPSRPKPTSTKEETYPTTEAAMRAALREYEASRK